MAELAPIVFETGGLPAFGGLTDPLGHAPDVLPIMYRDASAAAASGTRLTIGGEPCALAAAYYTEGFAIGVLTTGVADLRLVERPAQLGVGARWVYAREGGELVYDVAQTQVAEQGLPHKAIGRWFPYVASLMLFIFVIMLIAVERNVHERQFNRQWTIALVIASILIVESRRRESVGQAAGSSFFSVSHAAPCTARHGVCRGEIDAAVPLA